MFYNLEKKTDRLRVYNFSRVGSDREWLQDLLLKDDSSESTSDESVTEEEIRREMKLHFLRKKYRKCFYASNEVISSSYKTIILFLSSMLKVWLLQTTHKMFILNYRIDSTNIIVQDYFLLLICMTIHILVI